MIVPFINPASALKVPSDAWVEMSLILVATSALHGDSLGCRLKLLLHAYPSPILRRPVLAIRLGLRTVQIAS
jgi:hypothetical protein